MNTPSLSAQPTLPQAFAQLPPEPLPLADLPPLPTLFCDGGVLGRNPSHVGGTWAWCLITADGGFAAGGSGLLIPANRLPPWPMADDELLEICPTWPVTNNQSEFYASLRAIEYVPDDWTGRLCSDSQITLGRLCSSWRMTGIPPRWIARAGAALKRLGPIEPVLLQGHPTKADLARGIGAKRNLPVSEWNVRCDEVCNLMAQDYLQRLKNEKGDGG